MKREYFMKTARIGFSEWTADDSELARLLWGNKDVTRYISASGEFTPEEIEKRLQKELSNNEQYHMQYWPFLSLDTGELIGCCGLRPRQENIYELGFHLLPAFWGKGYAAEAAKAVIAYAFSDLKAKELFAGHNPYNTASRRVLQKLGFEYTGDEYYAPTGLQHPSYILTSQAYASAETHFSADASGFVKLRDVIPDILEDIRYYSSDNFVGETIDGYEEALALLSREAANALKQAGDELRLLGYRLKIFDAYRPQKAVDHFVRWAKDPEDIRMKEQFYPELEKEELIPGGYIAEHSSHSRGSTIDLTLFDTRTGKDIDMGGEFDLFGERSHFDYPYLTGEQQENRKLLKDTMEKHGFRPLPEEWWHFTLENEPYPDTYFTFPVSSASLNAL